jgi:excisionase family DNA binding protein
MKTTKRGNNIDEMSDLISQAEAARLRGVTRAAIADLIKRGKLRAREIGGRNLVYRSEVVNYEKGAAGRPKADS